MENKNFIVETDDTLSRLDKYLSIKDESFSRNRVQQLLDADCIKVNDKLVKSSYKVKVGDVIDVSIPDNEELSIEPEDIPLDILYEDHDIIVINKPKGMVVHPSVGNWQHTLVNALLFHCHDLSGINGVMRPGIVHRIDKDTTGCIVACKNDKAHEAISKQLQDKTCHREYIALVHGVIEHDKGTIDAPIGRDPKDRQKMCVTDKNSRDAVTHFEVLERFKDTTLIKCSLETGRTHQIRVHMQYIKHPIVGDPKYSYKNTRSDTNGQILHAYKLTLVHPTTNETMTFEAPLPEYFVKLLEEYRGN